MLRKSQIALSVLSLAMLVATWAISHATVSATRETQKLLADCTERMERQTPILPLGFGADTSAMALAGSPGSTALATSATAPLRTPPIPQEPAPPVIEIGPGRSVKVSIWMDRGNLVEILSMFFSKGGETAKERFESVLKNGGDVTLVLTTVKPK